MPSDAAASAEESVVSRGGGQSGSPAGTSRGQSGSPAGTSRDASQDVSDGQQEETWRGGGLKLAHVVDSGDAFRSRDIRFT